MPTEQRAGWEVAEWCPNVPIAESSYYALSPDVAPRSVKIGRKRVITESPAAWLTRIAEMGGLPSIRSPKLREALDPFEREGAP